MQPHNLLATIQHEVYMDSTLAYFRKVFSKAIKSTQVLLQNYSFLNAVSDFFSFLVL